MPPGLTITVVDRDIDYIGIEIRATSGRFAGSTWIYADLDDLSRLADAIKGFPKSANDERTFTFGSRDPATAGGYASLTFRCVDASGHSVLEIAFEDDENRYSEANAQFTLPVEAAGIDRFVNALRDLERNRSVEAVLHSAR